MKTIGIVTWFHHSNFGTALQVTALSNKIREFGYNVKVINYIPDGLMVINEPVNTKYLYMKYKKKFKEHFNDLYISEQKEIKFQEYINEKLDLTKLCKTKSELFDLNQEIDAFVCGSDQVWTPLHFDTTYYLDFVDNGKKIAYAPSLGVSEIKNSSIKNTIREMLESFSYISVREEKGKEILKSLTNKSCEVVLDPTLLMSCEEWKKILYNDVKISSTNEYLLCYFLGDNKAYWSLAEKYAKKHNLEIKVIPVYNKDLKRGHEILEGIGPTEFFESISNANCIFTDSFHGMIFSIILKKQFYAFKRFNEKSKDSQNSRVHNLMNITGLQDRLYEKNMILHDKKINYDDVEKKLRIEREKSIKFLKNALNNTTNSSKEVNYISKITNTCCGCGVCANICPKGAIKMEQDKNGFIQAVVETSKCVNCKLCILSCPFRGENPKDLNEKNELFMVKSLNQNVLKKSSSGGIGYEIALYYLKLGYKIIGCAYNYEKNRAEHIIINNDKDLYKIQGSKYIQSNLYNVLSNLKVSDDIIVFGTPCQISGISKYLNIKNHQGNFILVELICHGVPSYNLWDKYLTELSNKIDIKSIEDINFRDKTKSWREKYITIKTNKSEYCCSEKTDDFLKSFSKGHSDLESCYNCKYRNSCVGDLKIGDFWGDKFKEDVTGVSMAIVGSEKGKEILMKLQDNNIITLNKENIEDFWLNQACKNPIKPVFRDDMLYDYKTTELSIKNIYIKYENDIDKEETVYRYLNKVKKIIKK